MEPSQFGIGMGAKPSGGDAKDGGDYGKLGGRPIQEESRGSGGRQGNITREEEITREGILQERDILQERERSQEREGLQERESLQEREDHIFFANHLIRST